MICLEQPLVSQLRVFEDGKAYGDKYNYSITCLHISNTEVELRGADKLIKVSEWRSIYQWAQRNNIRIIRFERIREDKTVDVREIRIKGKHYADRT